MNTQPNTIPPQLQARADQAERLAQQGQPAAAARIFEQVLAEAPDYSRALSFFAMQAYMQRDLARARDWIDRAAAGQPKLAVVEAFRARILQDQGEQEPALQALEAALELDPDLLPARLEAGALLEQLGRPNQANQHYRKALANLPPPEAQPPQLRSRVEQARRSLANEQRQLEETLGERLGPLVERLPDGGGPRFQEAFDIMMGRKRPQMPKAGFLYFPKLPPLTIYPREMFEWAAEAEAATDRIRGELLSVMSLHDGRFMPYVQKDAQASAPGSAWSRLNHSHDWDVYFLYNQGERVDRHCEACPQTAAWLDSLPLVRIPGRGPTAFFSRLRAGAHIPPHHGATNTRLIVHLPLVVPPDCAIRVGNDTHAWKPGELVFFDDTIEHEAWNRSDQDRVVLIFDVWNPFMTEAERELVTELNAAMAEFYPERLHQTDF